MSRQRKSALTPYERNVLINIQQGANTLHALQRKMPSLTMVKIFEIVTLLHTRSLLDASTLMNQPITLSSLSIDLDGDHPIK